MDLKEAISILKQRRANLRCKDVRSILENLGFEVKDGNLAGHKIYTHDGLDTFVSGSFNCGHGKNGEIKPPYITKIIRVLLDHEEEWVAWKKGAKND